MGIEDWNLLERKYWRGETSSMEEERLRTAARENRPGLSDALRNLMTEVNDLRSAALDEKFDAEFWASTKTKQSGRQRKTAWIRWAAAVIVLLVLALAIKLALDEPPTPAPVAEVETDTYDNPQAAFREAKRALMFTSDKLNEGAKPMMEIKKFDQAKNTVKITGFDKDTLN